MDSNLSCEQEQCWPDRETREASVQMAPAEFGPLVYADTAGERKKEAYQPDPNICEALCKTINGSPHTAYLVM